MAVIRCACTVENLSRLSGGEFIAVGELNRAMSKYDVHIDVFGLIDGYTKDDIQQWSSPQIRAFKVKGPKSFGYAPGYTEAILESQPDIVHCHGIWMYTSIANLKWSRRTSRPYVVSTHGALDPWALSRSRGKKWLAGLLYENAHLKRASCIHALCQSEAESIRKYGLAAPICVIPNGINEPIGSGGRQPPWVSRINSEKRIVLFLGRIHPKKGISNLLKAWSSLRQNIPKRANEWTLVIAGWGDRRHQDRLKKEARELDLNSSVLFLGPVFNEVKAAAFENASAFVLPSFSEGLPMAVLEAWSYGLPVIMTPQCNIPEGFEAEAAIRVEAQANSIAQGLECMLTMSDKQRLEMSRNGRALTETKFSWQTIGKQMSDVYRWLLGRGDMPSCVLRG